MSEPVVLRCACCGLPYARVQNGCLVVESRHHGEKHTNAISLADVARLFDVPVEMVGKPEGSAYEYEHSIITMVTRKDTDE